ncbi:hypothetical protein IHE45_01G054800 [Dioscorea alata]|uniref:Uncharacterized protein n=1 Tax=Dioscorea alata TaxID=55571 RepID=A0ACB7WV42_DIOAL|nr:hypothetical protein IHE45_01G054800 [Dioscorea alata]
MVLLTLLAASRLTFISLLKEKHKHDLEGAWRSMASLMKY